MATLGISAGVLGILVLVRLHERYSVEPLQCTVVLVCMQVHSERLKWSVRWYADRLIPALQTDLFTAVWAVA